MWLSEQTSPPSLVIMLKCVLRMPVRCNSTLSQIRLAKPKLKKSPPVVAKPASRRKGQDLENINYIRSLLNKTPEQSAQKDRKLHELSSIVTAITVSESINLKDLVRKVFATQCLILVPEEVVNVKGDDGNDIMVLSNGTIVGWGVDEAALLQFFLPKIENFIEEKYNYESDEMDWVELEATEPLPNGHSNSHMKGEMMIIQGSTLNEKLLDKAAFAVGLSRSTRLAVLETALEEHIQITRINSEQLAKGTKLQISERDVLKLTGRLFLLRGKLNLYSELIETPDLFWAEPALEKLYDSILKSLDISTRISILNRKLDYATEESSALLSFLNERKGTRLEWIIIILITVEVVFEIERKIKGI